MKYRYQTQDCYQTGGNAEGGFTEEDCELEDALFLCITIKINIFLRKNSLDWDWMNLSFFFREDFLISFFFLIIFAFKESLKKGIRPELGFFGHAKLFQIICLNVRGIS